MNPSQEIELKQNTDKYARLILTNLEKYQGCIDIIKSMNVKKIANEIRIGEDTVIAFCIQIQGLCHQIGRKLMEAESSSWENILFINREIYEAENQLRLLLPNLEVPQDDSRELVELRMHSDLMEIFDMEGIFSQRIREWISFKKENENKILSQEKTQKPFGKIY